MPNITLTVNDAQARRIAAAFGRHMGLGRDATPLEVKQHLAAYVTRITYGEEKEVARTALPEPAPLVVT